VFADKAPDIYTYKLINTYPHDKNAYTQGLEFYQGMLYESTGQYGLSSIRKTAFATGEVIQKLPLDASYFGEGLTFINDEAVQLTWKENLGFIYDPNNFKLLRSFNYEKSKEGWGLCNDGKVVYKTDGTEKLWKLDPSTFEEIDFVDIVTHNKLISKVNELEYVNGLIYANTYQFNKEVVLIIKPATGQVVGVVDFSGLKEQLTQYPQLDVFNGIAYHPKRNSFFVTGKYWDKLFEVKIVKK
jgi:glutamine cyclotransferase